MSAPLPMFARSPNELCGCRDEHHRTRLIEVSILPEEPSALRYHYGCSRCGHYWRESVFLSPSDAWRMEVKDPEHGTLRLTNGRAQLSIWTGEVEDPDLMVLDHQLAVGAGALSLKPAQGTV